jgi:predicted dehydrogenase
MYKSSRREFLEQSMLAATAALATGGAVAPRSLIAREQASKSPNEKLKVAVIGVNSRGMSHVGDFSKRPDTEVAVICDVDKNVGGPKAESLQKAAGYPVRFVQDLRRVMDDKTIDIVTIATPNHWHALASIWAVQAGKDVYVEKPVSHNVSEGRRIVEFARKHGKIVQTGTQCRSSGGTVDAIAYIHAGKIGEVKLARGLCYKRRNSIGARGTYAPPASLDYDLWCGPAPMGPVTRPKFHYDWHWQWDFGNGDLGNQGIHQMDVARWGLKVSGLGDGVVSYGGRVGYVDAGETANTQICIHSYGDKRLVFEVRGLATKALRDATVGVIFEGTEGYVVQTSYSTSAAFDKDGNMVAKFTGGDDHFGNFLKAVRSRKISDLTADIEEGHQSSALCHLGNISYRLGKTATPKEISAALGNDAEAQETLERFQQHLAENTAVNLSETPLTMGRSLKVDGRNEVFVGEGAVEANPHLTRAYRKGYEVPASA